MEFFEPVRGVVGRVLPQLASLSQFLCVSHAGGSQNIPDFVDGPCDLGGSCGSPGEFNKDVLDVLNTFPFNKKPLNVFLSLLQLSLEFSVFLFDIFVVLVKFFILVSQQKQLLLFFLDVADQIGIRLVGLVKQRTGDFQLILRTLKFLLRPPQNL